MQKLLLTLLSSILIFSCSESDIDKEADLVDRNTIVNGAGFGWFQFEYSDYKPEEQYLTNVASNLESDEKILMFVEPSCKCRGTQKDFPRLMRSIDDAGITESKYEIYTMKEDYGHPYLDIINFDELPQAYLIKNNQPVYSLFDSLNTYRKSDSLKFIEDRIEFYLSQAAAK